MIRTFDPADDRPHRPVGQVAQDRRAAGGAQPDQELRLRGGDLGQELPAVKAAVHQHQHRLIQQVQQLARPGDLSFGRGPEHRADQRAGAGLAQGHQLDDRVAGHPERGVHLAQPGPVPHRVGDLDRPAAIKGHRPVPAKAHPRRARPAQRAGQHLKQRLHRRGTDTPAQVPQRPRRRRGQAQPVQGRGQLRPHAPVPGSGKQAHRQHEIQPHPRGQHPQPPLPRACFFQHTIGQLERHDPGQLAQMAGREHAAGHRDRPGDGHDSSTAGRLNTQRRSSGTGGLGGFPSYRTSVAIPGTPRRSRKALTAGRNP